MVNLNLEQAGMDFVHGIVNALTISFNNSNVGDQIASSISNVSIGIIKNLAANVSPGDEMGQFFGSRFAAFSKSAFQGTGWSSSGMGSETGTAIRDFLSKAIHDLNMASLTGDLMDEASGAFKVGVTKLDLAGNMNHLAVEFDSGMGVFRSNFVKQLDLLNNDVQGLASRMVRDATLKTLPWIALGTSVMVGTPLLTLYLYKRAVHNIGRPQLAREVRKVALWDRTKERVADTVSSIWNSAKTGVKWGVLGATGGCTLAVLGAITSGILFEESGSSGKVLKGISCALGTGPYDCDPSSANLLMAGAIGLGVLRGSTSIAQSFYRYIKTTLKKANQPVFNEELQKRIDILTKSTQSLNRNGDYMQNLLLYGPGGTGKTMISKYIAMNSNMNYVMMSGGDLAQYIKRGEHVTELNKLFEDAKSSDSPTILFIDECDSLCGERSKMDRSELVELLTCFLNHTGEQSKKVMVILTTNRIEDLDPVVLSRMDHKLYVGLPKQPERKKIIENYLPIFMTSLERKELFTDQRITAIAEQTEGFSGRTIFKMLNTLSSMRAASDDNKLTEQMVADTVSAFVKQEADTAGN